MSITLAIAVYFVIWWTTLFTVLPFGLRTQAEDGEVVPGTPGSAPTNPRIGRLFLINTAVATLVFAVVWLLIRYQIVPLTAILRTPGQ